MREVEIIIRGPHGAGKTTAMAVIKDGLEKVGCVVQCFEHPTSRKHPINTKLHGVDLELVQPFSATLVEELGELSPDEEPAAG